MSDRDIRFSRASRTTTSESYIVKDGTDELGRVDLHFGASVVYGSLIVSELEGDDILDLIELIDEQLVLSADVVRDDFVITVYKGEMVGIYSDDSFEDDDDEEDGDEDELADKRNGH